jgi:hypothetical protein
MLHMFANTLCSQPRLQPDQVEEILSHNMPLTSLGPRPSPSVHVRLLALKSGEGLGVFITS